MSHRYVDRGFGCFRQVLIVLDQPAHWPNHASVLSTTQRRDSTSKVRLSLGTLHNLQHPTRQGVHPARQLPWVAPVSTD